ncbi:MAG: glutamate formimidoyltransferase [Candidatus Izimaplasma sp.]|nr:glutamate formimidoyltransferase [Candidatus Izimaplasma bacterium]
MTQIVQCVPNFSEGRDQTKIEAIVKPLKNKQGFKLVSYEPDADYNRTVVTLIGDPQAISDALIPFVKEALKQIDMNHQSGEHPRMGAVDVIPFIPIQDIKMEDCVAYANKTAKAINDHFDIPIYMYAKAANEKKRINLPTIRKGEFEGLKEKIKDPKWMPDYGEANIHPTFGAIGVGARIPLIAYNIDIDTKELTPAKKMSRAIRHSSGGFRFIQAGPVYLESREHTQVTMNILNYKKNPIYRILETIKMEAKRFHVRVPSCELVGLIPKDALLRSVRYYLEAENKVYDKMMPLDKLVELTKTYMNFRDFDKTKIIEYYI